MKFWDLKDMPDFDRGVAYTLFGYRALGTSTTVSLCCGSYTLYIQQGQKGPVLYLGDSLTPAFDTGNANPINYLARVSCGDSYLTKSVQDATGALDKEFLIESETAKIWLRGKWDNEKRENFTFESMGQRINNRNGDSVWRTLDLAD